MLVVDTIQGVVVGPDSGDDNNNNVLETTETWNYSVSGPARPGQYVNLGRVAGFPPTGPAVEDEDPSHYFGGSPSIDIEKSTNGQDADIPTGPLIPIGNQVIWTYVVTNLGNLPLSDVVVTDNVLGIIAGPDSGDTNNNGILETTEVWTYRASGVAESGQYANTGTVVGTPPGGPALTDEDPSHYFGGSSSIHIEKATNGQDADIPTGRVIPVGDQVTWTYVVTNTGNLPLSDVVVTDDILGVIAGPVSGDTNRNTILENTETWTYRAIGLAQPGQYANMGTVVGSPPSGLPVTDEDPSHYFGGSPSLDIEKATNGQDADTPTGPRIPVGDQVIWTYVVTNGGNLPLSNVVVTDDILGVIAGPASGDTNNNGILESSEVWTYTANGLAVPGQYANVGTVVGTPPSGPSLTDEDPSHYFGIAVLGIPLPPNTGLGTETTSGDDGRQLPSPWVGLLLLSAVAGIVGTVKAVRGDLWR